MSERQEEEVVIQERINSIGNAFESQDYEKAVEEFTAAISEWTHLGRTDTALELAEKVAAYRDKVPEEYRDRFDIKLGEASFHAGNAENGLLEEADVYYSRVVETPLPETPEDPEKMSDDEKRPFAENFHAHDQRANVAFAKGDFGSAAGLYRQANEARGAFEENATRACALYGEAASALMLGEIETYMSKMAQAREKFADITTDDDESELETAMDNLTYAADQLEGLTDDQRDLVIAKMTESVVQRGGANGGVKHTNFRDIADMAMVEVREDI